MARARNIKPAFFKNYELADAGPIAQLLFAGLWCLADKEGRLEDKPRLIKAEIFPYYDADINGELTVIERLGFVRRYTSQGIAVIEILNFKKHQNPHHTEKASELPAFVAETSASDCFKKTLDINGELTVNSPLENGEYLADSLLLIPDSLNTDSLIPDSLIADSRAKDEQPAPIPISLAVLATKAMIESGIAPFEINHAHPNLLSLIEAGALPDEFRQTAAECIAKGKVSFAYVLATMINRRAEVKKIKPEKPTPVRDYGAGGAL